MLPATSGAKASAQFPERYLRRRCSPAYLIQCVCQAGHELSLDKLGLLVLELALLLDPEGCGLHAELGDLVGPAL